MADTSSNLDYQKWKSKRNYKKKLAKEKRNKLKETFKKRSEIDTIELLEKSYDKFDSSKAETYQDFPLSSKTKLALNSCRFNKPTAIQRASILPALKGKDILGAAKTGSGKTLAFLIPVLECLYRYRWNSMDGPGALVISPTRELALQTFEVLCKVGCKHDFSAGLVIGGKNVKEEAERVCRTNIVVCTPGRLLQHLNMTTHFSLNNLKVLVLDEADRILDLGFSETVNAIIQGLPTERQTLLFSATQTKSIKDLARLSLVDPVYISVHAESRHSTPSGLNQRYVVCPLSDKLNMLFSFVKNHVKCKTLVFVSSCKQVQYLFAAFCLLRPGVPVMHLHGNMNQIRRLAVFQEFCRKKFALLIATDIASRGLDFPAVDWVVQMDCPEDVDTYIHRVGRTARFHGSGNALMILLPSEKIMIEDLSSRKVPIESSQVNIEKLTKIDGRLQFFCAQDQELKEKAKRCFVAYFKSVHMMKNKSVFKVEELAREEFAMSLGLAVPPRIRFLQRLEKRKEQKLTSGKEEVKEFAPAEDNENTFAPTGFDASDDDSDELFSVKPHKHIDDDDDDGNIIENVEDNAKEKPGKKKRSKGKEAKRLLRKGLKVNQKILFGDDGKIFESWPPLEDSIPTTSGKPEENCETTEEFDIKQAQLIMKQRDVEDRARHRKKITERHRTARLKAKEERRQAQAAKGVAFVPAYDDQFSEGNPEFKDAQNSNKDMFDEEVVSGGETVDILEVGEHEIPRKRQKKNPDSRSNWEKNSDDLESQPLTLQDQEVMVLHLLKKNK